MLGATCVTRVTETGRAAPALAPNEANPNKTNEGAIIHCATGVSRRISMLTALLKKPSKPQQTVCVSRACPRSERCLPNRMLCCDRGRGRHRRRTDRLVASLRDDLSVLTSEGGRSVNPGKRRRARLAHTNAAHA